MPEAFRVSPATPADAEPILAFWNPLIENTLITFSTTLKTVSDVKSMIQNQVFFVAKQNENVLGFATYSQFRGGDGYARTMEHTIILAPQAQGKGIGRVLLNSLENHARDNGCHSLVAGISGQNPAGLAFHETMEYVEVARIPEAGHKFKQWLDLVLTQKLL